MVVSKVNLGKLATNKKRNDENYIFIGNKKKSDFDLQGEEKCTEVKQTEKVRNDPLSASRVFPFRDGVGARREA